MLLKRDLYAQGFSSIFHNQPESGSDSRVQRGRWVSGSIAHTNGRIASGLKKEGACGTGYGTDGNTVLGGISQHTGTNTAWFHLHGVPEQPHAETESGQWCPGWAGRAELVFHERTGPGLQGDDGSGDHGCATA